MRPTSLIMGGMICLLTAVPTVAMAQTVEMIVPFSAGGGTDIVARAFEPNFSAAYGQTVIIRNIAGASGTIGAAAAAEAAPDGQTIGYLPIGPVAIQPFLRDTGYGMDSWAYVCRTTSNPVMLLAKADGDLKTLEDVLAQGKSGRIVYGSSGPGTVPHLAVAALVSAADLNAVHLPFEGTGPAMNAMAGGEIQLFADTASVLEANDVRALAVFAPERLEAYPDVPTMTELGHDLEFSVWQGLFAPAGTPEDRVASMAKACEAAVKAEAFVELAGRMNTDIRYLGPEEFEAFVQRNAETNRSILKDAGLIK